MNTPPIVSKNDSIYRLYPDVVSISQNEEGFTAYDKEGNEVSINMTDVDVDFAKIEYIDKRSQEYPSWEAQLDYIYHNGLDKWKTDIVDPIKAKYPKPS